jgi:hypothetical protein
MKSTEIRIFVVSVTAGIENWDRGRWITLPMPEDELFDVLSSIKLIEDSELRITDYESPCAFWEFEDLLECNSVLRRIIDEQIDINYVATLLDYNSTTLTGFFDIYEGQSYEYYTDINGITDVAESRISEGYYGEIPEGILQYIDTDAIVVDLEANGWVYYPKYRTAICPMGC